MAKNRKNQETAVRLVPALKTFLLCLLIGGSAAGYVLQKNTIYELGKQIREKEAVLERLKWENRIRANQLADLQSPTKIAERVREKKLGLILRAADDKDLEVRRAAFWTLKDLDENAFVERLVKTLDSLPATPQEAYWHCREASFANLTMDGERPLSLGDPLGENPAVLAGEELRAFFETAMRVQAEADVAYYPSQSVVGRLRAGTVRTGDVWVAESWVNGLVVVEVRGEDLAPEVSALMRSRGTVPQSRSRYRIATVDYVAREEARRRLGRVTERRSLGLLRDALVTHARAHGFRRDV